MDDGGRSPRPIGTSVPMTFRTMCFRNPVASMRYTRSGPSAPSPLASPRRALEIGRDAAHADGRDLAARVHAGVRPPGAAHPHGLAEYRRERLLQHLLHRGSAGLDLPAVVCRSLVLDGEPELHVRGDRAPGP